MASYGNRVAGDSALYFAFFFSYGVKLFDRGLLTTLSYILQWLSRSRRTLMST